MAVADSRLCTACLNSGLIEAFSIVGHGSFRLPFLGSADRPIQEPHTTSLGIPQSPLPQQRGVLRCGFFCIGVMRMLRQAVRGQLDYDSVGWYQEVANSG
jgi:hypothetical protein